MLQTPQEYIESIPSPGKEWLEEFHEYMKTEHGEFQPVMFRQRPMFKVGKSYLMFTAAKEHFTLHTLNFDLIEEVKAKLPRASFGKGSVKVKFSDVEAKPILKALCDEVMRLNQLENPPPVDVVPELPYEEKLRGAFKGGKAKWLPLYEQLRNMAKERLPAFEEYFPAVNIRWKHGSTFAEVSAVTAAMRVEFYTDKQHPEYNAIKISQTSANRVAHMVEITNTDTFPELLQWLATSYDLTAGKRG